MLVIAVTNVNERKVLFFPLVLEHLTLYQHRRYVIHVQSISAIITTIAPVLWRNSVMARHIGCKQRVKEIKGSM